MRCNLKFDKDNSNVITDVSQTKSGVWYRGKCRGYSDFLFCRTTQELFFIIFGDGSFGSHPIHACTFTNSFSAEPVKKVDITVL